MNRLFENWRKFINEDDAAFHGFKMKPTQMRVSPQCDTPPNDNQWETGEPGCPQFTDDRGIDSSHEDIVEAIEFLDNVRPENLIAYSRGGAVALAALARSKHSPQVTFVAPAWRRGWVNGIENPTYSNGIIIHGTADEFVPLWHSADLSLKTGMPLYVFEGMKHVNILKYKDSPESGRELTQEEKQKLVDASSSLNEKVFADYEADKGEWISVPTGDIKHDADNIDLTDELYDLIDTAYGPIGGHFDFDSPSSVPSDHDDWLAMDWDDDPQPDVLRVGKKKTGGTKMTAAGHDGQKRSKGYYIGKTVELLNKPGYYAEMSKRIADIMINSGVAYVDDPKVVQKILGPSKPIQWLGAHPEGKHPDYQGWYRRALGGHEAELKIMLGSPTVSVAEQTEPYQKKVKAKHKRMKIRLIGKGKGKHTAGSYKEKPSYDRSKSAPPGG